MTVITVLVGIFNATTGTHICQCVFWVRLNFPLETDQPYLWLSPLYTRDTMSKRDQFLVAVLICVIVLLALCAENHVNATEVVDCDAGRCVLMPIEDAADLAAEVTTCRVRLVLCDETVDEVDAVVVETARDCDEAYDVFEDLPVVAEWEACAPWWESLLWGGAGIGLGLVTGLLVGGLAF